MGEVIPDAFNCPISQNVMEYPFLTTAGNSYEYEAIAKWLEKSDSDPLSNIKLEDKTLVPNNGLRSQILAWFEEHPEAAEFRNSDAGKPPAEAYWGGSGRGSAAISDVGLGLVLRYLGQADRRKAVAQREAMAPPHFQKHGHTYTFSMNKKGGAYMLQASCDGSWVDMPEKAMFFTARGIVPYDPMEIRDTRVLPDTDFKDICKFGTKCNNQACKFAHPFVCFYGTMCRHQHKGCKFFHPDGGSVVEKGGSFPLNKECKYGTSCTNKNCGFAHSCGRMAVVRQKARVFITHSLALEELDEPLPLVLEVPDNATKFQFQGEFVFFFEPYPGTWAKEHYKNVIVHRFDQDLQKYRQVGEFSLEGHYCNCAVAGGRYLVLSFWPYEEEAVRTIWEGLRVARKMEAEIQAKTKTIESLRGELTTKESHIGHLKECINEKDAQITQLKNEIARLKNALHQKNSYIAQQQERLKAQKEAAAARQEAYLRQKAERAQAALARRQQREAEQMWRRQRQNQERARQERLRLRDPIHVYVLEEGTSGFCKEDWKLVVDYHKGAHDLYLGEPLPDGTQTLELTEHDNVFRFDLVVPHNVGSTGLSLPLVPGRLCPDF